MTTHHTFHFDTVHPSWQTCLQDALTKMDQAYLDLLYRTTDWLPGPDKIFSAFSLPVDQVNYVLFGESPYPRAHSANGYAFWDAAVTDLWSEKGLSKPVNRATSLRNMIKMLLVAEGMLPPNETTQEKIAALNKEHLIHTNQELFNHLLKHGFILLNATLVLRKEKVTKDAIAWQPFTKHILHFLAEKRPDLQLILLGNIANNIDKLIGHEQIKKLYAEHPYNLSFILNQQILNFFMPMHLLRK